MCGIAGRINSGQPLSGKQIGAVYSALERRGPDQQGFCSDGFAELIHTRLAVIDVEHGRQPMQLCAGYEEYTLVYNGELYNTEELRNELRGLGHHFVEKSDTEVLLHAYTEWKHRCVEKLNGIFAFAVWERTSKRLFLARDRIGVKPLFYYISPEGALTFASEIPALLAMGVPAELDANGVAELLFLAPGRSPGCGVLRGVREILPANRGFYSGGKLVCEPYWQLSDREHRDNFRDTVLNVRELVTGAIKRQLVSDVPVCTFLSGGLDSSAITSIAHRELGELHSFSVDYEDNAKFFKSSKFQPNPDSDYIGKVVDYLGEGLTHHSVILNTADLANALYEAVEARGLPGMADVDSSLLLFCREIKKHATVGLSGECADEYEHTRYKTLM
jgi:asparagine synthase (glutamine-hydrolysing)